MSFTSTDPQNHQGENTWFTPPEYIEKLGPFDLDPCTVTYQPFRTARHHFYHDDGECGIKQPWDIYGDVWLNPPYGKEIVPFVDKFIAHKKGVMLIFGRMGSPHVQKLITSGAFIYCLRKRIKFIQKDGVKKTNAGTDSIIVFLR